MTNRRPRAPIDMVNGRVLPQLLRFAVPMMLTGVLQLLYNAADLIVVGKFTGDAAAASLAAVGATGSLVTLILNIFIGLSTGANVVIARAIGAGDNRQAGTATHTAITVSVICGLAVGAVSAVCAHLFVQWMGTPSDAVDGATLYFRIVALGFPAGLVYNFGAAVLRSVGDTKRPLYFLIVSGMVNVVLNLFLVIVFRLGVAGVAIATTVSQYLSAFLVIMALRAMHNPCRLRLHDLGINKTDLSEIIGIGVPASIQSACFNIANVMIQSSINSFGTIAVAGNTAASNLEGFVYAPMDAVAQSVLTFAGQNMGAKTHDRIPKILRSGILLVVLIAGVMGTACCVFGSPLLSIYTDDADAIAYGVERLWYICAPYFLCGTMNCFSNTLRAMGHSTLPMFTCVGGVCGLRILLILTVFRWYRHLSILYASFPISWVIVIAILWVAYRILYRRLLERSKAETATPAVS